MTFNPRLIPEDNHGSLDPSQANVRFYVFSTLFRLVPAVSDIHESLTLPSPGARNVNGNKLYLGHNVESETNFNYDIPPGYKDDTGPIYIKSTGLTFIILSISCMMLAFKAYCLGMVWDCYKYLMLNRRGNLLDDWYSDQWGHLSTFWSLLRAGRNRGNNSIGNSGSTNEPNTRPRPDTITYDPANDLPKYEA
ncbi:uncharacterized protein DC041_0008209, partial [Schistosoma bovis]